MHRHILALAVITTLSLPMSGTAELPAPPHSTEHRIAALQALQITDGEITLVRHDTSPRLDLGNNRALENLPPRTIVHIVLRPAPGSNIHVELCLPEPAAWNQRLVGLGNGGAAGYINTGRLHQSMIDGYAAVTTDMGTAPDADSGIGNREVWKDFGYRATHLMTVVGKQVVAAFYGQPASRAYFVGGSTGGQQALQEAQRYPEDYDGIVAAIPAHCRTPLHAYFLWNEQILARCPFTPEQETAVIDAGTEYLAARETPPLAGRLVSDPRRDQTDIEAVIALALKKDPTLTAAHADALRKLFDGPRHAVTGERIFEGVPLGSSLSAAHGHLYLFKWLFGADADFHSLDFGRDFDAYTAALAPYLNAENPDLAAFRRRGGKLLITTGAIDSIVPSPATIDYYERVIGATGGLDDTRSFCRLFVIPGMAHGGGPRLKHQPDLLKIVSAWREDDIAPDSLDYVVLGNAEQPVTLPVFPYPVKTGWDAQSGEFIPVDGPRGGVDPIAPRFFATPAE